MRIVYNVINHFKDIKNLKLRLHTINLIYCLIFAFFYQQNLYCAQSLIPEIIFFNKKKITQINIFPNYEKKIFSCELDNKGSSLNIYEKKWILSNLPLDNEIFKYEKSSKEIYNNNLEFNLASSFKFVTCEIIVFDGLIFKKLRVSKNYSDFSNWPILSPPIQNFSNTTLNQFSLTDFIHKNIDEKFECKSLSKSFFNKIAEEKFCSFIDPFSGLFYSNSKINYEKYVLENRTFNILNLKFLIKSDNYVKSEIPLQIYLDRSQSNFDNIENETKPKIFNFYKNVNPKIIDNYNYLHNFKCSLPEELKNSNLFIFWYINKEIINVSKNFIDIFISNLNPKQEISCLYLSIKNNILYFGADTYKFSESKSLKPLWIKDTYLIDILKLDYKEYIINKKTNIELECQVVSEDSKIIINNLCKKDNKGIFLSLNNENRLILKKYFYQNPPLDELVLPKFKLFIKSKLKDNFNYNAKIYFYKKNFKPKILYGALINDNNYNESICAFAVYDPQKSYLTGQFYTNQNKLANHIISVYSKMENKKFDFISKGINEQLTKSRLSLIYYKFKKSKKHCRIVLSNGSTISEQQIFYTSEKNEFYNNFFRILRQNKINYIFNFKENNDEKYGNDFKNYIADSPDKENKKIINYKFIEKKIDPYCLNKDCIFSKTSSLFPTIQDLDKDKINFIIPANTIRQGLISELISEKKEEFPNNFIRINTEKNDNLNIFFSSEVIINPTEYKLICKIHDPYFSKTDKYIYNLYSNGKLFFSKITDEKSLNIKINKLSMNNTFTCTIKSGDKIDASSFTFGEKSNFKKTCYGLNNNYALFPFKCPQEEFSFNDGTNIEIIKQTLINQFKNIENILLAKVVIWSESQKNKRSLTFQLISKKN